MFMFWSKRAVLTRRLLKAKVRGEHETECEAQEDTFSRINVSSTSNLTTTTTTTTNTITATTTTANNNNTNASNNNTHSNNQQRQESTRAQRTTGNRVNSVATRFHQGCCGGDQSHDEDEEPRGNVCANHQQRSGADRLTRCKELLKSLKENQLEMLLNVVESYGADFGSCVLVPRGKLPQATSRSSPVFQAQKNRRDLDPPSPSPPPAQIAALKQQEMLLQPSCNRLHQRSISVSSSASFNENNSACRLPHRHALRSRRQHQQHHHHLPHHPQFHNQSLSGSRCSRCATQCHSSPIDDQQPPRISQQSRDDFPSSPNEPIDLLRLVDAGAPTSNNAFLLEDLRQDQPAWSPEEPLNYESESSTGFNEPPEASRPERDRCRRNRPDGKTIAKNPMRKRRDSSSPPANSSGDSCCQDSPLDDPHLLSCQIWRWPDLANSAELKKLPVCHSAKDPVYVCCNPYHWSRLCKPESPPPPYCLIPDRLRPEDRAPSEISGDYRRCVSAASPQFHSGSLTTNGEGGTEMGQKEWCTLAYWELGGRVGRLYPVEPSTVNVFDSLHDGDGLCLSTLAENHVATPAVQRTRSKIGLGLMLSQESDGVWAYNRSESPIFVNSPTLDDPESRTLLVYRVPPGFCLNIFDRAKNLRDSGVSSSTRCLQPSTYTSTSGSYNSGPVDVNSVRISFAKGWGPKYSRQEVTSCPCWLEVLLAPCR